MGEACASLSMRWDTRYRRRGDPPAVGRRPTSPRSGSTRELTSALAIGPFRLSDGRADVCSRGRMVYGSRSEP
jgi:hypothetical protein